MLLFRSEEHVGRWCRKWGLARGWYGDRLVPDWRRKTVEEAEALLAELGLTSEFWDLEVG